MDRIKQSKSENAMIQTSLLLRPDQEAKLAKLKAEKGINRSQFMRIALDKELDRHPD